MNECIMCWNTGILEYLKRISVNMNFIFSFQMGGRVPDQMYVYLLFSTWSTFYININKIMNLVKSN